VAETAARRLAVRHDRHEGVGGELVRLERVRVRFLEREPAAARLADDPGLGLEDPRPEPAREALDQADRPPLVVDRGEADRPAPGTVGALDRYGSAARDLVAERGHVAVVEQGVRVHPHVPRVGEVPVAVERGRAEHQRERARVRSERVGVDPEALDRGEDLEQHEPLRGRRRDVDVEVPVATGERREDLGTMAPEVLERHVRAVEREAVDERSPDRSSVDRVEALGREGDERASAG
jgi:hypothetical protein